MIATERNGQLSVPCMAANDIGYSFGDTRYEARVLDDTDGRVVLGLDLIFELMVAIKIYFPP